MFNFENKLALISGASSGIGLGFAKALHKLGANVILVARRQDLLEKACSELNSLRANSAQFRVMDLCDYSNTYWEEFELLELDILVSNAGRGSFGYFHELDVGDELTQLMLNVAASLRLQHICIKSMVRRKSGVVLSLSSIAGFTPLPYMATYAATKAFNLFHALALHRELKPLGVQVLAVCPGPTETEFGGVARVPGEATGMKRESVESVVNDAFKALKRGRACCVTGWKMRLLLPLIRLTGPVISSLVVERLLKPSLDIKIAQQKAEKANKEGLL